MSFQESHSDYAMEMEKETDTAFAPETQKNEG